LVNREECPVTVVAVDHVAQDRLQQLGLSTGVLVRALLRADAEAKMTTGLEPPTAGGTTRYNKTVGFLREELVPLGWQFDNTRNFCRTVHPTDAFSIVTSSGDEFTGVDLPGLKPSTKYPKGELTALAVQQNADQGVLDFGADFEEPVSEPGPLENTWFLLQRVTGDEIYAELSLPTVIEGGLITDWQERIILPPTSRQNSSSTITVEEPPVGNGDAYTVDVSAR
jgi:hypothetical protein